MEYCVNLPEHIDNRAFIEGTPEFLRRQRVLKVWEEFDEIAYVFMKKNGLSNEFRLDCFSIVKKHCFYSQPERLNPENINLPIFECKRCKFSAKKYRNCNDGYIKCPECDEINICDSLNSVETQRERFEEVAPPRNRSQK